MATYKIGNKVTGIIRSFCAGKLGGIDMQYNNQPYTLLTDIDVSLTFSEQDKTSSQGNKNILEYNFDTLQSVTINNVKLTDRILALIYKQNKEGPLFSKREIYTSDNEGKIYLNLPTAKIYQVFIYDDDGVLESAFGEYADSTLTVQKADTDYAIYYSYEGEVSYFLEKPENFYVTIDFEALGNKDDGTQDMCIHIAKCILKINKNMYFTSNNSNAIDLVAQVIHTCDDYITLK